MSGLLRKFYIFCMAVVLCMCANMVYAVTPYVISLVPNGGSANPDYLTTVCRVNNNNTWGRPDSGGVCPSTESSYSSAFSLSTSPINEFPQKYANHVDATDGYETFLGYTNKTTSYWINSSGDMVFRNGGGEHSLYAWWGGVTDVTPFNVNYYSDKNATTPIAMESCIFGDSTGCDVLSPVGLLTAPAGKYFDGWFCSSGTYNNCRANRYLPSNYALLSTPVSPYGTTAISNWPNISMTRYINDLRDANGDVVTNMSYEYTGEDTVKLYAGWAPYTATFVCRPDTSSPFISGAGNPQTLSISRYLDNDDVWHDIVYGSQIPLLKNIGEFCKSVYYKYDDDRGNDQWCAQYLKNNTGGLRASAYSYSGGEVGSISSDNSRVLPWIRGGDINSISLSGSCQNFSLNFDCGKFDGVKVPGVPPHRKCSIASNGGISCAIMGSGVDTRKYPFPEKPYRTDSNDGYMACNTQTLTPTAGANAGVPQIYGVPVISTASTLGYGCCEKPQYAEFKGYQIRRNGSTGEILNNGELIQPGQYGAPNCSVSFNNNTDLDTWQPGCDLWPWKGMVYLEAIWEHTPITVTLNHNNADNAANLLSTAYLKYGEGFYLHSTSSGYSDQIRSLPVLPTRSGYIFGGYQYCDANDNCTMVVDSQGNFISGENNLKFTDVDITISAVWGQTYTATYSCGTGTTGTAPTSDTVIYGTTPTLPSTTGSCAKAGYTLAGWRVDGESSNWVNGTSVWNFASDKNLTAQWELISTTCSAGYYLAAGDTTCSECIAGNYCPGGTFNYNTTNDQGINICTGATYSGAGAASCTACPAGYTYNTTSGKTSASQCQIHCNAGTYVADAASVFPTGYTRLDYIQSSGSQYINTGIKSVVNSEFNLVAQLMAYSPGGATMLGALDGKTNNQTDFKLVLTKSGTGYFQTQSASYGNYLITSVNTNYKKHTFQITNTANSQTVVIDNGTPEVGSYAVTSKANTDLYLFARNADGTPNNYVSMRVYSLDISQNGTPVRKFIPARRNSDNAVGLYDTVTDEFFENGGSGAFTAGPNSTVGTCANVGYGYWAAASTVNFGSAGVRNQCPNWTTTSTETASSASACEALNTKFTVTTTSLSAGDTFKFCLGALGTFYVDWGDGSPTEIITRTAYSGTPSPGDNDFICYTHNYTNAGTYSVRFSGTATAYYNTAIGILSAISFNDNYSCAPIASVSGSLSALFPVINSESPTFGGTFKDCSYLTSVPGNMFSGLGTSEYMFGSTFSGSGLTSIPADLFAGVVGSPKEGIFSSTFSNCTSLTGTIPAGLFSGISGNPGTAAFMESFYGCENMSCDIPANLFSGIYGDLSAPDFDMDSYGYQSFDGTFNDFCSNAVDANSTTYIPNTLFQNITNLCAYSSLLFADSGLATVCPTGYTFADTDYMRSCYVEDWAPQVQCSPASYTVSYSCGTGTTGTAPTNDTVTYGTIPTLPSTAGSCAKAGYTLSGWRVDGESTDWVNGTSVYNYTSDKNMTAQWTENKYTATFECAFGYPDFDVFDPDNEPTPITDIQLGQTISLPYTNACVGKSSYPECGRTGIYKPTPYGQWRYLLNGRSSEVYGGTNFTWPVSDDLTFQITGWTAGSTTVVYSCGTVGGTAPGNQTIDASNCDTVQVENPTNCAPGPGDRFLGWYSSTFNTLFQPGDIISEVIPNFIVGLDLTAQWECTDPDETLCKSAYKVQVQCNSDAEPQIISGLIYGSEFTVGHLSALSKMCTGNTCGENEEQNGWDVFTDDSEDPWGASPIGSNTIITVGSNPNATTITIRPHCVSTAPTYNATFVCSGIDGYINPPANLEQNLEPITGIHLNDTVHIKSTALCIPDSNVVPECGITGPYAITPGTKWSYYPNNQVQSDTDFVWQVPDDITFRLNGFHGPFTPVTYDCGGVGGTAPADQYVRYLNCDTEAVAEPTGCIPGDGIEFAGWTPNGSSTATPINPGAIVGDLGYAGRQLNLVAKWECTEDGYTYNPTTGQCDLDKPYLVYVHCGESETTVRLWKRLALEELMTFDETDADLLKICTGIARCNANYEQDGWNLFLNGELTQASIPTITRIGTMSSDSPKQSPFNITGGDYDGATPIIISPKCVASTNSVKYMCYVGDTGTVDNSVTATNYAVRPVTFAGCNMDPNNFEMWLFSANNGTYNPGYIITPWTYGNNENFVPVYKAIFNCNTEHWMAPNAGNPNSQDAKLGGNITMPTMNCVPRPQYEGWVNLDSQWNSAYESNITSPVPGAICTAGDFTVNGGTAFNWQCPTNLTFTPDDELITKTITISCGTGGTTGQIPINYGDDVSALVGQWLATNCTGSCQNPSGPSHGYWKFCGVWENGAVPNVTPIPGETGCYRAETPYDLDQIAWEDVTTFNITTISHCPKYVKYKCSDDATNEYTDSTYSYFEEPYTVLDHITTLCTDSGYEFDRWKVEGEDTYYNENQTVAEWPYETEVTLVAQWGSAQNYTITYHSNYPNPGMSPETQTQNVTYNQTFTTYGAIFSLPGYIMTGWGDCDPTTQVVTPYSELNHEYLYRNIGDTFLCAVWQECPEGTAGTGGTCEPCPDGTQPNEAGTACEPCPDGQYSVNGVCIPCPAGQTPNADGDGCEPCPDGQYSVNGVCMPCPAGQTPNANGDGCEPCPDGTIPNADHTQCVPCTGATIPNSTGTACEPCPDGTVPNAEHTQCVPCTGATIPNSAGTACEPCPDGTQPNADHTECVPCPEGTYGTGGVCEPCGEGYSSAPGSTSINDCILTNCPDGQHMNHGWCDQDEVSCDAPYATIATRTWNERLNAYGSCKIIECEEGYHIASNACVPDDGECVVANGRGTREWNGTAWTTCEIIQCDPGYTVNNAGTACERCPNYLGYDGQQAVSSYITGCEIASCMYQGQKYALINGECEPICETTTDDTGSKRWDNNLRKCVRTCNPGYKMW